MEKTVAQEYFIRSRSVWFPDFEKEIESKELRYQKQSFHAMLALLRYFRSEITRQQFHSQFLAQEAPELSIDKTRYSQIRKLCSAYQRKEISNAEFDEQVLIIFRARPICDVFSPPFESWDEAAGLISSLMKKTNRLPPYFDGLGWIGYIKGNAPRKFYVKSVCDTADHLRLLLEYGTNAVKEDLKEKYSLEVSVALGLHKLCMNYMDGSLSADQFDRRFLQLAKEFCADSLE